MQPEMHGYFIQEKHFFIQNIIRYAPVWRKMGLQTFSWNAFD